MPTPTPKKPRDPFASIAEPVDNVDPFAKIAEPLTTEESEHARQLKKGHVPTWQSTVHGALDALPTVGGVVGGIAGGGLGLETGPGAIFSGAAGAAAGGGLGEDVRQELQEKIFPKEGKLTPLETVKALAVQAGYQGGSELLGRGTSRYVFSPTINALRRTSEAGEKAGFRLLPSEVQGTRPSIFETYPKASIFTSGKMAEWREIQNKETEKAAKDLADSLSKVSLAGTGSREDAGEVIRKGIEDHMTRFRASQKAMYDAINKQVGEHTVRVPIYAQVKTGVLDASGKPLMKTTVVGSEEKKVDNLMPSRQKIVDFAKKALDDIEAGQGAAGKAPASRYETVLRGIIDNKSPDATYRGMQEARSEWLSLARDMNSGLSGKEAGLVKKMAALADESIADSMKKSGIKGLPELWRKANSVTREEHEAFEKRLVENLAAKKNPEDIALVLRGNSPGAIAPIGIQETREALSVIPKELIPRVRKQILLDTMYEASKKGTQPFNEKAFAKSMLQIGDERGEVLFGTNWKNIKAFSELLNNITESVGLQAASLSNPEILKQGSRFILESIVSASGAYAAHGPTLMAAALPLMSEAALWNTVTAAIIHPQGAARAVNALRIIAKGVPYLATAGFNEAGGIQKGLNRVKEEAQKLKAKAAPAPQVVPPGVTHVYDPATDSINAVPQ